MKNAITEMKKIFKTREDGIRIMLRDGFILKETKDNEDHFYNEGEKAYAIGFNFNGKYLVYVMFEKETYEEEEDS